jgi:hypothetical protein
MERSAMVRAAKPYRTLLAGVAIGFVAGHLLMDEPSAAQAQIPNAGMQRNVMVDRLDEMNQTMNLVLDQLRNGTLQVRIVQSDKPVGKHPQGKAAKPVIEIIKKNEPADKPEE